MCLKNGKFALVLHRSGNGFVIDALVDDDVPVGKASGYADEDGAQRHDIFVDEKWRRRGIGTALAAASRSLSESLFGGFHWGELGATGDGARLADRVDAIWREGVPGWIDDMMTELMMHGRATLDLRTQDAAALSSDLRLEAGKALYVTGATNALLDELRMMNNWAEGDENVCMTFDQACEHPALLPFLTASAHSGCDVVVSR